MGIFWNWTAINATHHQFCPPRYVGVAKRKCAADTSADGSANVVDTHRWEVPDFTGCSPKEINDFNNQIKLLALGFSVAKPTEIINKLGQYLQGKNSSTGFRAASLTSTMSSTATFPYEIDPISSFLPGEGKAIVQLLKNIELYIWRNSQRLPDSFWNTSAIHFLNIIDVILSMPLRYIPEESTIAMIWILQDHVALISQKLDVNISIPLRNMFVSTKTTAFDRSSQSEFQSVIEYYGLWPIGDIKGNFRRSQLVAPPSFLIPSKNFTILPANITVEFRRIRPVPLVDDGAYICALLQLQPLNDTQIWDFNSCSVEKKNASLFLCRCSKFGTAFLLYAEGILKETSDLANTLWIIIYMTASISHVILVVSFVILTTKWFYQKTIWTWLRIQLCLTLLPLMTSYFISIDILVYNICWTYLLTVSIYCYTSTVIAMTIAMKKTIQVDTSSLENVNSKNIHLIALSLGIPLLLAGIHALFETFTGNAFHSWLADHDSNSSVVFSIFFSTLLLINIVVYAMAFMKATKFEMRQGNGPNPQAKTEPRIYYMRRCFFLIFTCVIFAGYIIIDQHWKLLHVHCITAVLGSITVLLWAIITIVFQENRSSFFRCCQPIPENITKHAVDDIQNGTALVESPIRNHQIHLNGSVNPRRENLVAENETISNADKLHPRSKRVCRIGPASLPLLQRAGLGPDVQRAFDIEAEKLDELRTNPIPGNMDTHVFVDPTSASSQKDRQVLPPCSLPHESNKETLKDDNDSGLGASGSSQKFYRLEKLSDALKALCHIRFKMPSRILPAWYESFRSRHSINSSLTIELGAERSSSITTAETEINTPVENGDGSGYRSRRSRTRWMEDYGQQSDLNSGDAAESTNFKPFRGHCLIRCSPEKVCVWNQSQWERPRQYDGMSDVPAPLRLTSPKNCERCWHNPETPACDLCASGFTPGQRSGPMFIRAVIEKPPQIRCLENDSSEYLVMDAAGSLAVDECHLKQTYYNLRMHPVYSSHKTLSQSSFRHSKQRARSQLISPVSIPNTELRRKISNGRITKKYRLSLRSVVHSTRSLSHNGHRKLWEFYSDTDFITRHNSLLNSTETV